MAGGGGHGAVRLLCSRQKLFLLGGEKMIFEYSFSLLCFTRENFPTHFWIKILGTYILHASIFSILLLNKYGRYLTNYI